MTRLNLVLLMAVLASALYLVNVQYESRQLFTALDQARSAAHRIAADNERLQVQRREQATPLRVERLGKEKLQMRTATPAITYYVAYDNAAVAAVAHAPSESRAGAETGARIP